MAAIYRQYHFTRDYKQKTRDEQTHPVITIDNTELEVVDCFTYLRFTVSSTASLDVEISSRIAKAVVVMAKLNKRVEQ